MPKKEDSILHDNILKRYRNKQISDKYELIKTLSEGSMGFISLVKKKEDKIGGSAFHSSSKDVASPTTKEPEPVSNKKIVTNIFSKLRLMRKESKDKANLQLDAVAALEDEKPEFTLSPNERRAMEVLYALKEIRFDRIHSEDAKIYVKELKNEINILKGLDHPNIVKAYEVYEDKVQIYVVMEFCYGGDLHENAPYTENQIKYMSRDILSAIEYLHANKIVHRDLKQENIMFDNEKVATRRIKIIDFGLSKKFSLTESQRSETKTEDIVMTAWVGTRYTMAPEVFRREYTSKVDLWAVGVIIYMLICEKFPFYHKNKNKMIEIISAGKYKTDDPIWESISQDCKDMIANLLKIDPIERWSASKALESAWFKESDEETARRSSTYTNRRVSAITLQKVENSLQNFRNTTYLKKVALNLIAKNSTPEEIGKLRSVFEQFDTNHDGIVTFEEFKVGLQKSGNYSDEVVMEIFESIDVNENGHIMYTEFLAATFEALGHIEEERIAEAFDQIDDNDSGFIDKKELVEILGASVKSKSFVNDVLDAVDVNKDGKVDYGEFRRLFRKSTIGMAEKIGSIEFEDDSESA